ncbi:MAG: hypothetical protein IJ558_09910 [Treponema sp.]|nr:hypothetical protein [Treponema sp.]
MRNFQLKPEVKKYLIIFATFFGIIFGITAILVTMTLVSRNSWKTALAQEMQVVLDDYSHGSFSVGKYLELNANISTSSAVYSLLKKDGNQTEKYYGVIVRVPSILGPVPAVFIYNEKKGVTFAGYASDLGKAGTTIQLSLSSGVMNYWEHMIPKILDKTEKR